MLGEYIAALNDRGVIHFSNTWEFFLESELQELYENSLVQVEKVIRNHMWGVEDFEGSKAVSRPPYEDSEADL